MTGKQALEELVSNLEYMVECSANTTQKQAFKYAVEMARTKLEYVDADAGITVVMPHPAKAIVIGGRRG